MASLAQWSCSTAQNGGYGFLLTSMWCSIAGRRFDSRTIDRYGHRG